MCCFGQKTSLSLKIYIYIFRTFKKCIFISIVLKNLKCNKLSAWQSALWCCPFCFVGCKDECNNPQLIKHHYGDDILHYWVYITTKLLSVQKSTSTYLELGLGIGCDNCLKFNWEIIIIAGSALSKSKKKIRNFVAWIY